MGGSISNHQYSVPVHGSEKPGQTPIFLHPSAKPYLTTAVPSGSTTLYEILKHSESSYADRPYLGVRTSTEYLWKTYAEIVRISHKLGLVLRTLSMERQDLLGIYAKNRYEWIVTDLACVCQSLISVPIYEMAQRDNMEQILNETKLKILFLSGPLIKNVIKFRSEGRISHLTTIILYDNVDEEDRKLASSLGLKVFLFNDIINQEDIEGEDNPPQENDMHTICYTSGTTGKRKGAIITHKNLVAVVAGVLSSGLSFSPDDSHLSYLPLAHMMERAVIFTLTYSGASIGFYGGDAMKIRDDLALLKPTVFISVPRLFNRFYELIIKQFNSTSGINKILIGKALAAKMDNYHSYQQITSTVWDKLVFSSVKNTLGGRVRFMLTGSAPITGEVLTFLRIVFSCPIIEGYGLTESCAASFVTLPDDLECGHIGGPLSNVEAKIVDVSEMKYFTTDTDLAGNKTPRGELMLRGPTIFTGYYNLNEDSSEQNLDSEGWLHTGDIVIRLHHNGAFKVIDRKKNVFKLAQGEYVAPEKIESVYILSEFIQSIFVYGDSFQSFLIAVVVPREEYIRKVWGVDKNFDSLSFSQICCKDELRRAVIHDMDRVASEAGLYGYEQVKRIYLEPKQWSTANLLTPTLKLMRFKAKMHYQGVIAELYSEGFND